eukprot:9290968-Prorocentrum_lima.AAC.1
MPGRHVRRWRTTAPRGPGVADCVGGAPPHPWRFLFSVPVMLASSGLDGCVVGDDAEAVRDG